jgi:hypothetical protein
MSRTNYPAAGSTSGALTCGRLLEVGSGRIDHDRNVAHVSMNRQPIGGYTGYVMLTPIGTKPEPPQSQPQRPGDEIDADEVAEA